MNKKILTQFFLILVILSTSFIFYRLFLADHTVKLKSDELENIDTSKKNTNQINDFTYYSKSLDDNIYTIKAEFAEINNDNPDFMLMTNVKGKFMLKNSDIIEITSKKANYNSINYNTNFYQDVLVTYEGHQINSDNFDLFFDKKLGTVYNNIVYKDLSNTLLADKIDIDLITKDSKIYMLDKSEKIKIKHLN
jgi:uncharacterized membrane protein|tara:strand:+ start:192 stop:770 length:579 start_codon:yes stop_codon:yes gene_type:complete